MVAITSIIAEFKNITGPELTSEIKIYELTVIYAHDCGCMGEGLDTTHFSYTYGPAMICLALKRTMSDDYRIKE